MGQVPVPREKDRQGTQPIEGREKTFLANCETPFGLLNDPNFFSQRERVGPAADGDEEDCLSKGKVPDSQALPRRTPSNRNSS